MSTFVLVHGAWHGAWCWYRIVPRLAQAGHTVLAPDLPSLGSDRTPIKDVTLAGWAESIGALIEAATEPVVLVGHSRGGIVISSVAERLPERIARLVYVAAFLLRDGETLLSVAETVAATSRIVSNLLTTPDQSAITVPDAALREGFYGQCPEEDVTLARMLLQPEAAAPSATAMHVTPERFGRVPRAYIECRRDQAIPIELQRRMARESDCPVAASLDTDHSPFFSTPEALVEELLRLAPAAVHPLRS
jgi:pimeloyl-ACP methyl ester carboxylesterase